jgi:hypothetical protein
VGVNPFALARDSAMPPPREVLAMMGGCSGCIGRGSSRCEHPAPTRKNAGFAVLWRQSANCPPGSLWWSVAGAVHRSCPGIVARNPASLSVYDRRPVSGLWIPHPRGILSTRPCEYRGAKSFGEINARSARKVRITIKKSWNFSPSWCALTIPGLLWHAV